MIIAVQGTKGFRDYDVFMRAMTVALTGVKDNVEVWSAGPHKVNNFTAAFCNSVENYLRAKNIKITFRNYPAVFIEDNLARVDYLAYLGTRSEGIRSPLVARAETAGVEVGVYQF